MGENASTFVEYVDQAFWIVAGISFLVLIGIMAAMIYFVIRYRRSKNPHPTNIEGSLALEITWTLIPLVLFLGMFYIGWVGYKEMRNVPKDALAFKVTARMWQWTFDYPNGVQTDTLYVPVNTPVRLEVTSADVNHSLFIPAFRIKKDAIPGKRNMMWFKATRQGAFDIACAEYCGLKHSMMYTKVVVQDSSSFDAWYRSTSERQGKPYSPLLAPRIPVPEE